MNKNCLGKINRNLEKVNFSAPRIVIGGTNSGTGKTTITCAILMALKKRGYNLCSFKCGPDYIDPMFHRKVFGIPATNLDLFFTDKETTLWIMKKAYEAENVGSSKDSDKKIAVMEGVMGYYDGVAGTTSIASTYDLAKATQSPAILLVDGKGKSLSLLAEIKGFLEFRQNSNIKGVIINRISGSMYGLLRDMIREQLGVEPLGYFPVMSDVCLESRHLGLVTADEIEDLEHILDLLASKAEETLEIDKILELAGGAENLEFNKSENVLCFEHEKEKLKDKMLREEGPQKIRIGVARDEAFCFYYNENLKMLEELGCQLVEFSPLRDNCLPRNLDGIILGGGYPELYGKILEENLTMREDILAALDEGMPCVAECGGFMYLHEGLLDREDNVYKMVGALEGKCFPLEKMGRFGYINLEFNRENFLGDKETHVKGHEFHYWESENTGDFLHAQKPLRKKNWQCVVAKKNIFAGFPHLYFWSNPEIPSNLVVKCLEFNKKNR